MQRSGLEKTVIQLLYSCYFCLSSLEAYYLNLYLMLVIQEIPRYLASSRRATEMQGSNLLNLLLAGTTLGHNDLAASIPFKRKSPR